MTVRIADRKVKRQIMRALLIGFPLLFAAHAFWQINQIVDKRFRDAALVRAIYHHNTTAALRQLRAGVDPNVRDDQVMPCSFYEAATLLYMMTGAEPAATSFEPTYPNHPPAIVMVYYPYAEQKAQEDVSLLKALLDKGANVNATDDHGQSALLEADQSGYIKSLQLLIAKGANVNQSDVTGTAASVGSERSSPG